MKTNIALLTAITSALTMPAGAGTPIDPVTGLPIVAPLVTQPPTKATAIEQRLLKADIEIALKQYERLKAEAFESRFRLELGSNGMSAEKQRKLEAKVQKLEQWVKNTRDDILKTGDRLTAKTDETDTDNASKDAQELVRAATYTFVPDSGIKDMPPCKGTVEGKSPCSVLIKTTDGKRLSIGGPGATPEVARFINTLREGQTYDLPDAFLDYQKALKPEKQ